MSSEYILLDERIRQKKELLDALRPLPADVVRQLYDEVRLLHTYNSNAIEGNTLTLSETKVVLEEGITIGGKTIREHLEATNNARGFDLILRMAEDRVPVSHVTVQKIHEVVTLGILEHPGCYRTKNVRISGAARSPPDWHSVVRDLDLLFAGLSTHTEDVIRTSAVLHHRFVAIHPFIDGNGRVARLLSNQYLVREGYPPLVLEKERRMQYYQSLRQADLGNPDPFLLFIAHAENDALSRFLSVAGGRDRLVPLSELADASPYSQEYLSLAARKGLLDATKIGTAWHSTLRALDSYRRRHGRK